MSAPALFHNLVSAWQQDAAGELVEVLAAELAATAAHGARTYGTPYGRCVGVYRAERVRSLFGLACFLDTYGLTLRQRYAPRRAHAFVFVEVSKLRPSEFEGTWVLERQRVGAA
jgi:hypothetical protein